MCEWGEGGRWLVEGSDRQRRQYSEQGGPGHQEHASFHLCLFRAEEGRGEGTDGERGRKGGGDVET